LWSKCPTFSEGEIPDRLSRHEQRADKSAPEVD